MTATFLVTITTAEELRLLEQEKRAGIQSECKSMAAVFDEFDDIRAHGLGVRLESGLPVRRHPFLKHMRLLKNS
ncbi:MAG: hypothetical protein ABR866_08855 [Candidatus Korobacteraceae bacterium]|jgi:hypothetical protein